MVTAFQVLLIIIMAITALGAIGEKDRKQASNMAWVCVCSMTAFIAATVWL
ncbi:hypothetical protein ACFSMW_06680 [Virgibacillus halophilus]|uniref:Uncharacterized protein n=1 Tax=Tigheibacillus halophilus TaxID=361280 RepID=A0ABU5C6C1_9BACI|nr:hypothetical protein [Virgibacillus halophilus]